MHISSNSANVVGGVKGKTKPQQLIIFCAHYDHIGTNDNGFNELASHNTGRSGDLIYNGANDNASGVAALITLAKHFARSGDNERTILFVAFTGEELGLLGSKYFASQFEPDSIIAVVNIEMIGRRYKKSSQPFITGSQYSDLLTILNKRLLQFDERKYGNNFFGKDRSDLFWRSDNYSFASRGVPAHSIMGIGEDLHYHSPGDEASTLNYQFMNNIVQAIAISCRGLTNGEDTPKRIRENL
jgi:Zn-dependent M28 family amino/carboxypeptidase